MHDLRNLSDAALMDLLSEQTARLTSLLVDLFANGEYLECKQLISSLTKEMEMRKNLKGQVVTEDRFANDNNPTSQPHSY